MTERALWEYRVEEFNATGDGAEYHRDQTLVTLGAEGWELVAVGTRDWADHKSHHAYFKRALTC